MRIAIVADWFSEKMGYAENNLPKALAAIGHDVHLITSNGQVYFDSPEYDDTYAPFLGPALVPTGVRELDGYTLHRLPHGRLRGRLRIKGLQSTIRELKPDIVQVFEIPNVSTLEAAWASQRPRTKFFLESHIHKSVFSSSLDSELSVGLLDRLMNRCRGSYLSARSELCYPISDDCAAIAVDWFGIDPRKIRVCSLGVDTDLFQLPDSGQRRAARSQLRSEMGFDEEDVVCIYTGRFSRSKGPDVLAKAVDSLSRAGEPYKGVFIGSGTPTELARITDHAGCRVHPFVPSKDLPPFYWAADIGVWPMQESTSQLDAAASGLPIVLSDRITVRERVDGNGLTYREGDASDLAAVLLSLRGSDLRDGLGRQGSDKMRTRFSWRRIAQDRTADYGSALGHA